MSKLEIAPTAKTSFDRTKTIYIPHMADHGYALVGALAHCGIKGVMLPMHTERSLEYGRRYTGGAECLPFILTTGDFIKLMEEEPSFDPERSALFMATSCGPCRFGQYYNTQKLIFAKMGHDIDIISTESYDSYTIDDLGTTFRHMAWNGIVAVDLLQKLLWSTRPYELNEGETDRVYEGALMKIEKALEREGVRGLVKQIKEIIGEFKEIQVKKTERPLIGIVGEIYIRTNEFSNANIVRLVEELGGEVRVAPVAEWFYYTNRKKIQDSTEKREFLKLARVWLENLVQIRDERVLGRLFRPALDGQIGEPSVAELIRNSDPYIKEAYRGEPVLDIGKAVDFIKRGADGIINVMPFSCMPGTMVSAVSSLVRKDHGNVPWLNLTFDGQKQTNLKTRLEAFIFQARRFAANTRPYTLKKDTGTRYNPHQNQR